MALGIDSKAGPPPVLFSTAVHPSPAVAETHLVVTEVVTEVVGVVPTAIINLISILAIVAVPVVAAVVVRR